MNSAEYQSDSSNPVSSGDLVMTPGGIGLVLVGGRLFVPVICPKNCNGRYIRYFCNEDCTIIQSKDLK